MIPSRHIGLGTLPLSSISRTSRFVLMLLALVAIAFTPVSVNAQDVSAFPNLQPDVRVYDETGTSLTAEETAALNTQIASLSAVGADVIVYVRALDADVDETLEQVESLQQSWVALTGANQDNAIAILINRNPGDPNDARAGVFVGSTFDDGNVPRGEQEAIVADRLIPPLRNGDVYGSLSGSLTRLESSIINGPPQSSFDRWASEAASSWLPWVGSLVAAAMFGATLALSRSREDANLPAPTPSLQRPGDLNPVLAATLATGSPPTAALPAMLLRIADHGAIVFEPEGEGGLFSKPSIQVRLVEPNALVDEYDQTAWALLGSKSVERVISSRDLKSLASAKDLAQLANADVQRRGWINPAAARAKVALGIVSVLAFVLAVVAVVIAGVAGNWWAMVAPVALAAVGVWAIVTYAMYSSFNRAGQNEAAPWIGYRKGLERAAKDKHAEMDLDAVLPDAIAMNLGPAIDGKVKRASESGLPLRALAGSTDLSYLAWWPAFNVVFASSSSSTSSASGGGAGGGGGAAGST